MSLWIVKPKEWFVGIILWIYSKLKYFMQNTFKQVWKFWVENEPPQKILVLGLGITFFTNVSFFNNW